MTYFELVDAVRAAYANADASEVGEHIAFQFNIEGEGEGAFYLEIKDGKINIEPYEYYDRDVLITTTAETLLKIGTGKLDPIMAYTLRKIKVDGNLDKALVLKKISPKSTDINISGRQNNDAGENSTEETVKADDTDAKGDITAEIADNSAVSEACSEAQENGSEEDADSDEEQEELNEETQEEDASSKDGASTTAQTLSARRSGRKGKRKRGK